MGKMTGLFGTITIGVVCMYTIDYTHCTHYTVYIVHAIIHKTVVLHVLQTNDNTGTCTMYYTYLTLDCIHTTQCTVH